MSDFSQGPGWWQASDGKWYAPEQASGAAPPMTAPPMGAPPMIGDPYAQAGAGMAPPAYGAIAPVYGGAQPGMSFDQASGLSLPPGTQLAPVGRRIGAFFLALPLMVVTLGIGYIIWGLILWGKGQTPALKVLGMRCYKPTEARVPGFGGMALREIVGRFVGNLFGVMAVVSFILFLTSKDHRAIHDMIGGTVVLHDPNKVLES
jgi:uncharacterized RDD family membrane protein YckC